MNDTVLSPQDIEFLRYYILNTQGGNIPHYLKAIDILDSVTHATPEDVTKLKNEVFPLRMYENIDKERYKK